MTGGAEKKRSRPTPGITRRAFNADSGKFSTRAALIRGRVHAVVRGRPNLAGTRSAFNRQHHSSNEVYRTAAQPRHSASKKRRAARPADHTTPTFHTGDYHARFIRQLLSVVRINMQGKRGQNPSSLVTSQAAAVPDLQVRISVNVGSDSGTIVGRHSGSIVGSPPSPDAGG